MRAGAAAVLIALALASAPAPAQPYKWTDKDGNVHYGDRPPKDAKLEEIKGNVQTYSGEPTVAALVPPAGSAARSQRPAEAPDAGVTLYGTVWCGTCKHARAWLAANRVPYRDFDIEQNATALAVFKQLGGTGVPLIVAGDKMMLGFSAARMEAMLKRIGLTRS